jgi:hypothetical protein
MAVNNRDSNGQIIPTFYTGPAKTVPTGAGGGLEGLSQRLRSAPVADPPTPKNKTPGTYDSSGINPGGMYDSILNPGQPASGGGAGGGTGSLIRSFTQPLSGVLQSVGVKDKITAQYLAAALFLVGIGALIVFIIRRKARR